MKDYKKIATRFHQAVSAYDKKTVIELTCPNYIQHNPNVPTGQGALVGFLDMLESSQTKIQNLRMIQDKSFVVMHHRWLNAIPFGFDQTEAFHIIRFDENQKIAEHWNVMKAATIEESIHSLENKKFQLSDFGQTKNNKTIIKNKITHANNRNSHAIFGEGNYVMSVSEGIENNIKMAYYDLFRLEDSNVVEHWPIYQEIPSENLANDNTMFGFDLASM